MKHKKAAIIRPARSCIAAQDGMRLELDTVGKYHLEVGSRQGLTLADLATVSEMLVLYLIRLGAEKP